VNVVLISECTKKALVETRRILDQFAERRGERSWQTSITEQGLDTLHRLIRKTARRNTAVACFWVRGKNHNELCWVVGDGRRFNAKGNTPTNVTARDILKNQDENDWHYGEEIRLLTSLAALFHDFGKSNQAFQKKLSSKKAPTDAFRHEWVSLRLLEAFVGKSNDDTQWLQRLVDLSTQELPELVLQPLRDGVDQKTPAPLKTLPPIAKTVGWLILSHHRMPFNPEYDAGLKAARLQEMEKYLQSDWGSAKRDIEEKEKGNCWTFSKGLPITSKLWREHAGRIAQAVLARSSMQSQQWLHNPYVLHLSRLALMLADHYYSSQPSHPHFGDRNFPLYANTEDGKLKQRLDEHLIGVEINASRLVRTLPSLEQYLPRLSHHKAFMRRTKVAAFQWQDNAFDKAVSLQASSSQQGFFGVNMASTGCGKTLANGRILYGLSDPKQGARFSIALGLRTLTLQTGDAYRERLGLGSHEMAVLVGGGGVRALHEHYVEASAKEPSELEKSGRESSEEMISEHDYVHFDGSLGDGPFSHWLEHSPKAKRLLNAPILICTIDHLIPSTEGTRGGRQIAPMLRLLSSDLVLDEPDDFSTEDLPALTRLVHWSAMLGGRILLSSATLPPALIQGLFQAYREGRKIYQENRGELGKKLSICCAWFDEYHVEAGEHETQQSYAVAHRAFVDLRIQKLALAEKRRQAFLFPMPIPAERTRQAICQSLAESLREQIGILHDRHHSVDPKTGKKISFGLIRMANIGPLTLTAQALYSLGAPEESRIYLCVYHSQHLLLMRSSIERRLDRLLKRNDPEAIFRDSEMRTCLRDHPEPNQIFVVIATAVAEVGRDHDYDWAVVEPSSMRSIIQLAGRVRRHREGACTSPNLHLLDTNCRHLQKNKEDNVAFCRPGYESKSFPLESHSLTELLTTEQIAAIDASPRIRERDLQTPTRNLADLEHACLRALMLGEVQNGNQKTNPVHLWWTTRAALSSELQRVQPFRRDPMGHTRYMLLQNEEGDLEFRRFEKEGTTTQVNFLKRDIVLIPGPRIVFWGEPDYLLELETLSERMGIEMSEASRLFGVVDLQTKGSENGWEYHPALGFNLKA